jgi:hypothetical protein
VEHAYASGSTIETPWRTAAMVAAGVAAVELFILIVVAVFLGAKLVTDHAEKATSPAAMRAVVEEATKPAATTPATKGTPVANLPRGRTSIIVLNGNGTPGAASIVADRLSHFHYIVAATGNAPRSDFRRSVVMYRTAAFKGEALRLANDLHLRRVAPLDGMTRRDLQGAHLALIIGG